jgi:cholesterol oxidase
MSDMTLPRPGIEFGEVMTGRITKGSVDPIEGFNNPCAVKTKLRAQVRIPYLRAFLADGLHRGDWSAELFSAALDGVLLGEGDNGFRLFERQIVDGRPIRAMVYDASVSQNGRIYKFKGRKTIGPGPVWRVWRATTRLEVTVHENNDTGPVVAAGILRLTPLAFLRQLTTMRVTGPVSTVAKPYYLVKFLRFFGGSLVNSFILWRRW